MQPSTHSDGFGGEIHWILDCFFHKPQNLAQETDSRPSCDFYLQRANSGTLRVERAEAFLFPFRTTGTVLHSASGAYRLSYSPTRRFCLQPSLRPRFVVRTRSSSFSSLPRNLG